MSNQKRVAVVILNWNGSNMMRQFLPSVVKGTGEDGEVIVADNGSSDDSCDMLSREFPDIKQIRLPKTMVLPKATTKRSSKLTLSFSSC